MTYWQCKTEQPVGSQSQHLACQACPCCSATEIPSLQLSQHSNTHSLHLLTSLTIKVTTGFALESCDDTFSVTRVQMFHIKQCQDAHVKMFSSLCPNGNKGVQDAKCTWPMASLAKNVAKSAVAQLESAASRALEPRPWT